LGLRLFIASASGREMWLAQCVASLEQYPATVVTEGNYELGKLKHIYDTYDEERFVFLQDSTTIVSAAFWELLEQYDGSVAFLPDPYPFGCYMAVYERSVLHHMEWPEIKDKEDSIRYEHEWTRSYATLAGGVPVLFPELTDRNGQVAEMCGRTNLVLENAYFRKWKGTWR